jgi:uncharacterized protein (TIGR03083 family)
MADVWPMIHAERAAFADTLASLTPEQWEAPSQCAGWRVHDVIAHMTATGYKTQVGFLGDMAAAGFRFNTMVDRDVKRFGAGSQADMIAAYQKTVDMTAHPPGPTLAMLGEVVIHGEDALRPLGMEAKHSAGALRSVADFFKGSNLLIGAKKRITGLTLTASDIDWSTGSGPEVNGPAIALIMAMTGRPVHEGELSGEGAATLISRR